MAVAGTKFSQIVPAIASPAQTDQVVGVTGGTTDNLYSITQLGQAVRQLPMATGNLTVYVSTTGSDSNPGTIAQPFATPQHGLDYLSGFDYAHQFIPTANVADGTYIIMDPDGPTNGLSLPEFTNLIPDSFLSASHPEHGVQIIGNPTTPGNVIFDFGFTPGSGISGVLGNNNSSFRMDGFKLQNGTDLIWVTGNTTLNVDDIIFDIRNAAFNCANVSKNGLLAFGFINSSIAIQGTVGTFIFFTQDSGKLLDLGCTWTITNALSFISMVGVSDNSQVQWPSRLSLVVNPGNLTGQQYRMGGNASFIVDQNNTGRGDRSQYLGTTVGQNSNPNRPGAFTTLFPRPYQKVIPSSGDTVNIIAGQQRLLLVPAAGLATLTVNLPGYMTDGEICSIGTSQTITALTVGAQTTFGGAAPTVVTAPTTLAAGSGFTMMFDSADNAWYMSD